MDEALRDELQTATLLLLQAATCGVVIGISMMSVGLWFRLLHRSKG